MRVADYIMRRLVELGVSQCFVVTGGGAMHLNDALGRAKGLAVLPTHHEQSAAIAAEAYGRYSGKPALVSVTTGPGGVNALNGVFGAWTDSIPMIVVSGQVKRETLITSYALPLRQLGDQEVDIVRMVSGITKFACQIGKPDDVAWIVDRAFREATSGRPGPVWIDVPIDIQAMAFDQSRMLPEPPSNHDALAAGLPKKVSGEALERELAKAVERLASAERPVILAGSGVRLSGAYDDFRHLVDRAGIPVATAWNAHDLLPDAHPAYAGRPGSVGNRGGNFSVQNADCVLVLGCRLNIRQISYNWSSFARAAEKIMIDIDPAELVKPTIDIDHKICADLQEALPMLAQLMESEREIWGGDYLQWCRERLAEHPVVLDSYRTSKLVNPYVFVEALFQRLLPGDTIVTGDGTACVVTFQAAEIKEGQRLFTNSGCASMGYDLPAAIGALKAGGGDRTGRLICLAGDGSAMMNIQELATIVGHQMPVKVFILNNDGYHSIRQTQQNYFPDNIVGCGEDSGLAFPDFTHLARGFGLAAERVNEASRLGEAIDRALNGPAPFLCEVVIDKAQQFSPKLTSRKLEDGSMVSSPLEDMAPFLSREALRANMLIPLAE